MAGFVVPSPTLKLTFEKYPDLEVRAGSIPLGRLLDLTDAHDALKKGNGQSNEARLLFDEFANNLRGWNCEYAEGMPVPADREGLYSLDTVFATEIIMAWYEAISGADIDKRPLDQKSTNGSPSEKAPFVPTEVL